jgi:hypothetical protein
VCTIDGMLEVQILLHTIMEADIGSVSLLCAFILLLPSVFLASSDLGESR